eukprot:scaffold12078_cov77-Skeletonema_marinoi.AAC.3
MARGFPQKISPPAKNGGNVDVVVECHVFISGVGNLVRIIEAAKMRESDNDEVVDAVDDGTHYLEAEAADKMCCASCGVAEVDDIKLNECNDCDLVQYCSVECQHDHRPQHELRCKERAAELRDQILFRQPDGTHLGDCPICFLPLSIDPNLRSNHVAAKQYAKDVLTPIIYAREKHGSIEEANKNTMKRAEANDPEATCRIGREHHKKGDYDVAFRYWTKAAEMGDVNAHFSLSFLYHEGQGVEEDEEIGCQCTY